MNKQDDPIYAGDYNRKGTSQLKPTIPVKPTQTVLELSKPCDHTAPDPKEVTNTQHIPSTAEAVQAKVNEEFSQL